MDIFPNNSSYFCKTTTCNFCLLNGKSGGTLLIRQVTKHCFLLQILSKFSAVMALRDFFFLQNFPLDYWKQNDLENEFSTCTVLLTAGAQLAWGLWCQIAKYSLFMSFPADMIIHVVATVAKCTEIFRTSWNVHAMSCHAPSLYRYLTFDAYQVISFYTICDPQTTLWAEIYKQAGSKFNLLQSNEDTFLKHSSLINFRRTELDVLI